MDKWNEVKVLVWGAMRRARAVGVLEGSEGDYICSRATDAILAALGPGEADGWVLVPREPTEAMVEAARTRPDSEERAYGYGTLYYEIWAAMLSAAPLIGGGDQGSSVVEVPKPTQEQQEYLERVLAPQAPVDMSIVVGGPKSKDQGSSRVSLPAHACEEQAATEASGFAGLTEPYVPVAIHFTEADTLDFVQRDVPTVARTVQAGLDVLVTADTREPIGWRIYGWSRIAPLDARPDESLPVPQEAQHPASPTVGKVTGLTAALDHIAEVYGHTLPAWAAPRLRDAAEALITAKRELAKCGRDNCFGQYVEGVRQWVSKEALQTSEAARLRAEGALTKISAIRDSIIGGQKINWSEHIYPLVAALGEAGFEGAGYEIARENLGTLIEQTKAAEARATEAEARLERVREALKDIVEFCDDPAGGEHWETLALGLSRLLPPARSALAALTNGEEGRGS